MFNDKKMNYAYMRGYMDGSGNSDRKRGTTSKRLLSSLLSVLNGGMVVFLTVSPRESVRVLNITKQLINALGIGGFVEITHEGVKTLEGGVLQIKTLTSRSDREYLRGYDHSVEIVDDTF